MIGKTISHYKILEKLGEGGMGVVFLAEDLELRRKVALKFLPVEYASDSEALSRFKREAQAAAALSHPNIITVHEVGDHEGRPFIVMEYIKGKILTDAIAGGDLSLERVIDIAIGMCDGLSSAHDANVVHRDIKPGNILIGADGRIKILDFGLAKLRGVSKLTAEDSTLGTVNYMSPEQARGQEVDGRSDIFSLGVVLYEMVTGQPPFRGDHVAAVMYSITNEDPQPLQRFSRDASDELERIVGKALAKEPSERYQNAQDMLVDLRALRSAMQIGRPAKLSGRAKPRRNALIALAGVIAVALAVIIGPRAFRTFTGSKEPLVTDGRKMIVVLPFENLGPPESEYFADGITEEITSRLASLSGLGVISRTSAFQYKAVKKSIRQIGDELGVDYVLEGTVRWDRSGDSESRVRVTPQLIRVADDTHLWSDRFDRVLRDIFDVQSEIANQVIQKLDVALLEPERQALEAYPTANMEAYQAYLRGMDYARRGLMSLESSQLAIQMFERAVELDSTFALGYAALSRAHVDVVNTGMERTQEHVLRAKAAVDRALSLQPGLPEANLALGYYYYGCHRDYDRALEEFDVARKRLPNQDELLQYTGFIRRRQGHWDEGLDYLKRALELDPRDAHLLYEVGMTYLLERRYAEAEEYYDRAIALAPDVVMNYVMKAFADWQRTDDLELVRATLERMPESDEPIAHYAWFVYAMGEGNLQAARSHLASLPDEPFEWAGSFFTKAAGEGHVFLLMGEPELARKAFESARVLLEREVAARPDDGRIHSSLGLVYSALGRREDAIREAELGVEMIPVSVDAMQGPTLLENLAVVYTSFGEYDAALDMVDYLLSIPSMTTVSTLDSSLKWAPLREHPRFQAILKKHSAEVP